MTTSPDARPKPAGFAVVRDLGLKFRETIHYLPMTRSDLEQLKTLACQVDAPDQTPLNWCLSCGSSALGMGVSLFFGWSGTSLEARSALLAVTVALVLLAIFFFSMHRKAAASASSTRKAFNSYVGGFDQMLADRFAEVEPPKRKPRKSAADEDEEDEEAGEEEEEGSTNGRNGP